MLIYLLGKRKPPSPSDVMIQVTTKLYDINISQGLVLKKGNKSDVCDGTKQGSTQILPVNSPSDNKIINNNSTTKIMAIIPAINL